MPRNGYDDEDRRPPWRGWHVIGRFVPMVFLGFLFIIFGLSPYAPHRGPEALGILFVWVGVIMIGAAVVGMVFTKCPVCYSTHWVVCLQEPDVHRSRRDHGYGYYRELSTTDEKP
ncbi:MAG TPA: hypothetical protein VMH49_02885 [Thermoplasmata archaeon]|nr:hypothetical protein [Thermoplasmata archaeon]